MNSLKLPFLILFLLLSTFLRGQENSSQIFDTIIGLENTDLASGTEYIEQHIIRNNLHKYFQSEGFGSGTVNYDGQIFSEIPMKYNVYDDLLLVNLINSGGMTTIKLHKDLIKNFSLQGHDFINLRSPEGQEKETGGFYEILLDSPSGLLLKKHLKKILKHLDKSFTYYEFEQDDPRYLFFMNNTYFPFDSRRDLFKIFPESKKLIRRYYRSNRSLYRTDRDLFLTQLFRNLQDTASPNLNQAD